ncbi:hypothetical protein GQ44DRAFT_697860 [Phaeosphaeriaceae sp. PMI808]|nr:hypothetical protein GQ44DRAFT_697860 [Phaeosphaeriaceae sp. PMI808]
MAPKQRAVKAPKSAIPEPFTPVPAELKDLLSTFSRDTVYITHIDTHPAWFKKRIFTVPLLLNLAITALLALRAYYILPHYLFILLSVLGTHNHTTIYWSGSTWPTLLWSIAKRGLSFMLDFFLLRIVGPWPWSFFLEWPGNPVRWRWTIGFRDEEVYVRQSRGWGAADLLSAAEGASGKMVGGASPFFTTRILPAIEAERLRSKTGYLLMDADFDLDFYGMIAATELLDRKVIAKATVRKAVFVYVGDLSSAVENGQWAMWDCAKLDEGSETEARKKIVLFKDKLTAMGKESLFFKWVELIQFESSAPGGFTQERQVAAAEKAKKMFEAEGVDFDEFSRDIGGVEGMPGV